jgi:hypothetical protein
MQGPSNAGHDNGRRGVHQSITDNTENTRGASKSSPTDAQNNSCLFPLRERASRMAFFGLCTSPHAIDVDDGIQRDFSARTLRQVAEVNTDRLRNFSLFRCPIQIDEGVWFASSSSAREYEVLVMCPEDQMTGGRNRSSVLGVDNLSHSVARLASDFHALRVQLCNGLNEDSTLAKRLHLAAAQIPPDDTPKGSGE